MNRKLILKLSLAGGLLAIILGGFFHFTFALSNKNFFVALFSAVNESVWEHLKLTTFPFVFFAFIEAYFLKRNLKNFFLAKTIEAYSAAIFIVVFFYSYTFLLGENFLFLDIGSFFMAVILGKIINYKILVNNNLKTNNFIWAIPLIILILFFFLATFFPPRLPLFMDSTNNSYGFYMVK